MVRWSRIQRIESRRLDAACAHTAEFLGVGQAAFLKYLHVLRDRGERNTERGRQFRNGQRPPAQPVQNGPPGRIAQCMKQAIDIDLSLLHAGLC
jgi:hypothetical protein